MAARRSPAAWLVLTRTTNSTVREEEEEGEEEAEADDGFTSRGNS